MEDFTKIEPLIQQVEDEKQSTEILVEWGGVVLPKRIVDTFPPVNTPLPIVLPREQWLPDRYLLAGRKNCSSIGIFRSLMSGALNSDEKLYLVKTNYPLSELAIQNKFKFHEKMAKVDAKRSFRFIHPHYSPWANFSVVQEKDLTEDEYYVTHIRVCARYPLKTIVDLLSWKNRLVRATPEQVLQVETQRMQTLINKRRTNTPLKERLQPQDVTIQAKDYAIKLGETLYIHEEEPTNHTIIGTEIRMETLAVWAFLSIPTELDDFVPLSVRQKLLEERIRRLHHYRFSSLTARNQYERSIRIQEQVLKEIAEEEYRKAYCEQQANFFGSNLLPTTPTVWLPVEKTRPL